MNQARAIADAVLYEGFLLFPYRKDALKNQLPFQFGVLMPRGHSDPSEPTSLRSDMILLYNDGKPAADLLIRFLQYSDPPIEREVPVHVDLRESHVEESFVCDSLRGATEIDIQEDDGGVMRLALAVHNNTKTHAGNRNEALRGAFISAHVLLTANDAVFVSLLDPPDAAKAAVACCNNERVFPVLAGEPADDAKQTARTMLVSPIIMYDFPRIAKRSTTHTFDATEIDELLMLSVASLSDEEKRAARSAHPYARALVERAEALDAETLATLHGELTGGAREPGDENVTIAGTDVHKGSRVRVHPKGRADLWDEIVDGMTGRVCAVHTDADGKRYVGVVFDADPASDLHEWYGRSFFYATDEVQPL